MRSISPGQRALRRGRVSLPGQVYLVSTVTRDRRPVFTSFVAGRCVVHALRNAERMNIARSLVFVIMPDHLHWLFELGNRPLGRVVGGVKARAAAELHARGLASMPLWQRGFHDRALRRHEDVAAAARYVVLNPVRAGLVRRIADYPLWDAIWL